MDGWPKFSRWLWRRHRDSDDLNSGAVNIAGIFGAGIGIDPYFGGGGTLNVMSGGTLVAQAGGIIGAGEATGTATVSGVGSALIINGGLFVGGQADLQLGPGLGKVTISDGGTISASGGVTLAPEAGSFGTLNIGAEPGNPAVAPGALNTPTVKFGNGTGAINFNHTGADYVLLRRSLALALSTNLLARRS